MNNELNISLISPLNGSTGVSIDTPVSVSFTKDLNKGTILKNFFVVKDIDNAINDVTDIQNKNIEMVTGSIKYSNKTISFTPNEYLSPNANYVVVVRKQITSITNEILFRNHIFKFKTKDINDKSDKPEENFTEPPVITYPKDLSIVNNFQAIEFKTKSKMPLILEVSDSSSFNTIVFKCDMKSEEYQCVVDRTLNDGSYYIRLKSLDSKWSDVCQIYLQNVKSYPVNESDNYINDINDLLAEIDEDNKELHVSFKPQVNRVPISNNKFLFEFDQQIYPDEFEITLNRVYDVLNDEEVEDDSIEIKSKTFYYDEEKEKSYVIVEV